MLIKDSSTFFSGFRTCYLNLHHHHCAYLRFTPGIEGIATVIILSIYQRGQTSVTHVNHLQWYRIFYHTNVAHFVSWQLIHVNHQGNPCIIKTGDICGGSNQMIILRCTGERAKTTFWQFHHALLHSSSSQNWRCWLWSKPKQGCDILKEVFQMISVTESIVLKHWQFFKGHNVWVSLCMCQRAVHEWSQAHAFRWCDTSTDICNSSGIQVKNTF